MELAAFHRLFLLFPLLLSTAAADTIVVPRRARLRHRLRPGDALPQWANNNNYYGRKSPQAARRITATTPLGESISGGGQLERPLQCYSCLPGGKRAPAHADCLNTLDAGVEQCEGDGAFCLLELLQVESAAVRSGLSWTLNGI